jgi:signal transduction histidine kinase
MPRALPVIATLLAAVVALLVIGAVQLRRDREALYERYGHEREQGLLEAARGFAGEIGDISEDLELAATLLKGAGSPGFSEQQLHAIATIKREYLVMHAQVRPDAPTRVTAIDAPAGVDAIAGRPLEELLAVALREPGRLHVSNPFSDRASEDRAAWYRVFARRPSADGPAVAVLVDMSVLLGRLKLSRDTTARVAVLDGRGRVAATSDRELAAVLAADHELLGDGTGMTVVGGEAARAIGLPDTKALAIAVPMEVDAGQPWTLLKVASTIAIEQQERTVGRRVLVGGALVLLLLLSAAAYVIRNSYRAQSLRESLRSADRLAHSEKLVTAGQLAAGIAHEVGTPLNVARGRVEMTLSHLGEGHAESANQQLAIEQIDRVTRLLQQLLDYVRPAPTMIGDVDLPRVLRAVVELLAAEATRRGVALGVDVVPSEPARLRADPDQVQQIVVNLALNALDASERGDRVWLRARTRDKTVAVEVVDEGHGIPRELQKQVFDPFFTTKKRGRGTGLGLWVVAELVRAQSAEIELDSAPGRGTTMRVTWPVSR